MNRGRQSTGQAEVATCRQNFTKPRDGTKQRNAIEQTETRAVTEQPSEFQLARNDLMSSPYLMRERLWRLDQLRRGMKTRFDSLRMASFATAGHGRCPLLLLGERHSCQDFARFRFLLLLEASLKHAGKTELFGNRRASIRDTASTSDWSRSTRSLSQSWANNRMPSRRSEGLAIARLFSRLAVLSM